MTEDFIDLSALFPLQAGLDAEIAATHNVSYESTFSRRLLSLLVELGEFANETRCFKYWSLKGPSPKERILDEYADGLHFLLSLGIPLGVDHYRHYFKVEVKDLTEALLNVYENALKLREEYTVEQYAKTFGSYLNLIPLFDYSVEEVGKAYLAKLNVNHKRQEDHY